MNQASKKSGSRKAAKAQRNTGQDTNYNGFNGLNGFGELRKRKDFVFVDPRNPFNPFNPL
jgi:hypothetical protein